MDKYAQGDIHRYKQPCRETLTETNLSSNAKTDTHTEEQKLRYAYVQHIHQTRTYTVTLVCKSASTTTKTEKSHTWKHIDTCTENTHRERQRNTLIEKDIDKRPIYYHLYTQVDLQIDRNTYLTSKQIYPVVQRNTQTSTLTQKEPSIHTHVSFPEPRVGADSV